MKGAAYPRLPSRIRLFAWFHAGRATGLYAGICGTVMEVGISYLYLLRLGSIRYFHLRRKDVGGVMLMFPHQSEMCLFVVPQ